jgi:hypothetical protein
MIRSDVVLIKWNFFQEAKTTAKPPYCLCLSLPLKKSIREVRGTPLTQLNLNPLIFVSNMETYNQYLLLTKHKLIF